MILQFSYFPFAAAFVPVEGDAEGAIDGVLVAIALVLAPLVFFAVGLISHNSNTPKRVLWAMSLLLAFGLVLGLVAPIFGAAAGFGVGIALTLNLPPIEHQMRRRLIGIGFALAYMLLLLFTLTPAGVLAGAFLPALMVGFADEYGAWREARSGA